MSFDLLKAFFLGVVEAEEMLHQEKVAGGGDRQELGQALDHAEDERLEKVEQHATAPPEDRTRQAGSKRDTSRVAATGHPEISPRSAFPASLTSEQRGRANIAQIASVRAAGGGAT